MFFKTSNLFFSFQKKLYLKCLDEVNRLIGKKRKYLNQYEVEFSQSMPDNYRETNFNEIVKAIDSSKIVLFGDFHTLANSQAILIETIKAYKRTHGKTKIIIALECFSTHDKKHIDDYLDDKISEKDFLKLTGYNTGWGFPWGHYKRIFTYAKEIKASIVPVNNPFYSVHIRDQKISENLTREIKKNGKNSKVFCLIGEFHLAERHLPVELKLRMPDLSLKNNIVKILINIDSYFFEHNLSYVPEKPTILNLSQSYYCILDTPPWIKWLTYSLWQDQDNHDNLERFSQKSLEANEYCFLDIENDDLEYKVVQYAYFLAKYFSIHINLDGFFSYNFVEYNGNDLKSYGLNSFEKSLLQSAVKNFDCYLCEKNKVVFYKRITLKVLISCAGQSLFALKTGKDQELDYGSFICREILKNIFSSLSQIVFNPYVYSNKESQSFVGGETKEDFVGLIKELNLVEEKRRLLKLIDYVEKRTKEDDRFFCDFSENLAKNLFKNLLKEQSRSNCLVKKNFLREDLSFFLDESLLKVLSLSLVK